MGASTPRDQDDHARGAPERAPESPLGRGTVEDPRDRRRSRRAGGLGRGAHGAARPAPSGGFGRLSSSGDPQKVRSPGVLARFLGLGATAQATVPGVYAWAVTVAPAAFVRGAPNVSRGAAVLGVFLLGLAPL